MCACRTVLAVLAEFVFNERNVVVVLFQHYQESRITDATVCVRPGDNDLCQAGLVGIVVDVSLAHRQCSRAFL